MLKINKIEEPPSGKKGTTAKRNWQGLKNVLNVFVFGAFMGIVVAVASATFVPQLFPEWSGSLVCPGRVQYVMFRQTYLCYTSTYEFFDLGDAMYWAVLKRALFVTVPAGLLFVFGLMKFGAFLYRRREAAGF
jgi:hypothetical protein